MVWQSPNLALRCVFDLAIVGRGVGLAARREDRAPAGLSEAATLFHIGVRFFHPCKARSVLTGCAERSLGARGKDGRPAQQLLASQCNSSQLSLTAKLLGLKTAEARDMVEGDHSDDCKKI